MYSVIYIMVTSLASCVIGMITAIITHPGTDTLRDDLHVFTQEGTPMAIKKPLDANIDVIRWVFLH